MAIYHLSAQVISRAAGRSAVAAAAYRAGEKLLDERLGEVHDFTRKQVEDRLIMAPQHAPEWAGDRQRLWNEVELAEKRKDAQLCREINVALPRELNKEQQLQLLKTYSQQQFVDRGMVADLTLHLSDPQNPHAHIMLTTRHLTAEGFGPKNRAWNEKELLQSWRQQWADHANRALERAGIEERIDHRSFQAQGITDRLPTIHEGPAVREMEKRGVATERGELNRLAKAHNQIVIDLQQYRKEKEALQDRNRYVRPEERRTITATEKLIGRPATLEAVSEELQQLVSAKEALRDREQRLKEGLRPFEMASEYYREIEFCGKVLEGSSGLKRLFHKQDRERHRNVEQRIARAEEKLLELGFKDRTQFESRKAKVEAYTEKERGGIEAARAEIAQKQELLVSANQILKKATVRSVAAQYPDWPAAKYLTYNGAEVIKALNNRINQVVSPKDAEEAYQKCEAEMRQLNRAIKDINDTASRLHGAQQWLEKYEQQTKEARKLFQSPKSKAVYREEADKAFQMMKQYGIEGRDDFNRQLADHHKTLQEKPALEAGIAKLQPGLNLLKGALEGFASANRQLNQERAQEQWKQRQKGLKYVRDHGQDQER